MNKRQDIRSRVLAQITGGVPSSDVRERDAARIKAHIAVVGEQVKEGFATRVEKLEAERSAGMVLLRLDPKTIGTTEFANRHELSLNSHDPKLGRLKQSIATHGQDTPVLHRDMGRAWAAGIHGDHVSCPEHPNSRIGYA